MKKNKNGFTLVELVIVIAVIAILAAVLIPTFAGILERARENARIQRATSARDEFFTSSNMISVNEMEGYIIDIDGYAYIVGENGQITNSGITENILESDPKTRLPIVNGNSLIYTPSTAPVPAGVYDSKMQLLYSWEEAINEGVMVVEGNVLKEFNLNEDYVLCIDKSINNLETEFAKYPAKCKKLILHNRVYLKNDSIKGMNLPYSVSEGVNYIGNNENPYVYAISKVVDQANVVLHEDCVGIYSKCFAGKNSSNLGKLKTIQVGDKLRYIGYSAFGFTNLTSFDMPDSVTLLQNAVFQYTKLTSLTLSKNVKTIPGYLIYYTKTLKSLEIPTSVTKINSYAFAYSGLTSINFPSSVETLSTYACYACSNLTSFSLPSGITQIPDYMFGQCGFTEVVIPSHIKNAGFRSFELCHKLTKITFSEGVESTGSAVYDCELLETVILPSTIKYISSSAFYDCVSLKNINFPEGLESIGTEAFYNCDLITSVIFPSTMKIVYEKAFAYLSNLTELVLNEGLTKIDKRAFCSTGITTIDLPSTLEELRECSFSNTKISSVVIPSSVHTMGVGAFHNCANLTKMEFMHTKDDAIQIVTSHVYWYPEDELPVKEGLTIVVHVAKEDSNSNVKKNKLWYYCSALGITPTLAN